MQCRSPLPSNRQSITVLGAGLAGTEAAWQIARAGIPVTIVEMRPVKRSPAHHSSEFAELVCSNSFGALSSDRAAGLLQEELRRLGSVVIHRLMSTLFLLVEHLPWTVGVTAPR